MTWRIAIAAAAAALLAGCGGPAAVRPVELLDERTGLSVAALQAPIELVPGELLAAGARSSFAYLGPVEWNRMGEFRYGLWLHVAPGGDKPLADIHLQGAVTLVLDDRALELSPLAAPPLGREPYRRVASWGQTAYFALTVDTLRRMAASPEISLRCRAADGSTVRFKTTADSRGPLQAYLLGRGLTAD